MTDRVTVRVFARLREIMGSDTVVVPVPAAATVSDLRRGLELLWPEAQGVVAKSAIAVNNEYAEPEQRIAAGDEVALIPPVSGGSGTS
jgi:molybdopterin converting factor subunit 1